MARVQTLALDLEGTLISNAISFYILQRSRKKSLGGTKGHRVHHKWVGEPGRYRLITWSEDR